MLVPVEVLPAVRRSLRRGVELEAHVIAPEWDAPRRHRVLDLSPDGLRLAAGSLLPVGAHVVVCFTPPGGWLLGELMVWGRVVRAEERSEGAEAALGLELLDLLEGERRELEHALVGRPPRLPSRPVRPRRELVWVDALEELEVYALDEQRLEPRALGPLLC